MGKSKMGLRRVGMESLAVPAVGDMVQVYIQEAEYWV